MKILYIEPYLGFSHKHWIEGYKKNSSHEIEILGLPARHWKWRMHGGAITLSEMIGEYEVPDLFLVSAMIDLPLFKSLLPIEFQQVPINLYFHENQFAYPVSENETLKRDNHFGFINFKSALLADRVFYNSKYNMESFLEGVEQLLKQLPDYTDKAWISKIRDKSKVLPLGMDFIHLSETNKETDPPLLLWNHRHEYDKNPELFFNSLFSLKEEGVPFRLAVLGESFRSSPPIFEEAKKILKNEIVAWGFLERSEYEAVLSKAALLPVTSNQDFFGISIIEAAKAGVKPILPDRLAYPENFDSKYFFREDSDFKERLKEEILNYSPMDEEAIESLERFSWEVMAPLYDEELFST